MAEEHKASPEMMKFFNKLLALKEFVNRTSENIEDSTSTISLFRMKNFLYQINKGFDEIIKEKKQ